MMGIDLGLNSVEEQYMEKKKLRGGGKISFVKGTTLTLFMKAEASH